MASWPRRIFNVLAFYHPAIYYRHINDFQKCRVLIPHQGDDGLKHLAIAVDKADNGRIIDLKSDILAMRIHAIMARRQLMPSSIYRQRIICSASGGMKYHFHMAAIIYFLMADRH